MSLDRIPRQLLVLLSAAMLIGGFALAFTALTGGTAGGPADNPTSATSTIEGVVRESQTPSPKSAINVTTTTTTGTSEPTVQATAEAEIPPITVRVDQGPPALQRLVATMAVSQSLFLTTTAPTAAPVVELTYDVTDTPVQEVIFAAASRFDTIIPLTTQARIASLWTGEAQAEERVELPAGGVITGTATLPAFEAIAVISDTLPGLVTLLDAPGATVQGYGSMEEVIQAAWGVTPTLALVPFDELTPQLTVLAVDGQNPVENANRFDLSAYPFKTTLYARIDPANARQAQQAAAFLAQLPAANRDPDKLTVLAMTGVTAMVRMTAAEIDERGVDWIAEVVGPELAAADITHISNEVPFVPDCETDTRMDNFNFCSPPAYLQALRDVGVDIVGLTGNHQNDFGREDALGSINFYAQENIPLYGGGRNKEEAFAPFYLEHNGNRLAFLGANSYGPDFAFATDNEPGSAVFDLAIMSAMIRTIKTEDRADLVLPELQYDESYGVQPLGDQRLDFNALVRAGADIVTGVQSHVPQAVEFTDDKLVLFGLGNLFFDQMWQEDTREGMIVKHTLYDGRHLSTQILTTRIYDYGQPRWMSADERQAMLERVFGASYW
ncbi:MAG: CapA family protein [Caldilineaceae bacterium]|nr:CapA family protein [Caldilineaceae bacterium]